MTLHPPPPPSRPAMIQETRLIQMELEDAGPAQNGTSRHPLQDHNSPNPADTGDPAWPYRKPEGGIKYRLDLQSPGEGKCLWGILEGTVLKGLWAYWCGGGGQTNCNRIEQGCSFLAPLLRIITPCSPTWYTGMGVRQWLAASESLSWLWFNRARNCLQTR